MTFKWLLPLTCEFLRIIFGGPHMLIVLLELKLKLSLTIPDSYILFMKLSDNFRLIEVLPVVPLDLCLGVHLEVLTSSCHTWVIPTHSRSIWHAMTCCSSDQFLTFLILTWPWPDLNLDLSSTIANILLFQVLNGNQIKVTYAIMLSYKSWDVVIRWWWW